jgi:hypothetical protein
MKRLLAGLVAVGALAVFSASAEAQYGPWGYYNYNNHQRYHDNLEHRDFHRYLYHRDAHRYPMTWGQHERLHDALEHDAYHDRLEHREYHRQQYSPYGYPGSGFGVSGRGFSIWFGHRH